MCSNVTLCAAATVGVIVALVRRDWRVGPLLTWIAATLVILVIQVPLFSRHAIVLIPPLVAISALAFRALPLAPLTRHRMGIPGRSVVGLLALAIGLAGAASDHEYWLRLDARAASSETRLGTRVAADLQRVATPDRWVVTDAQFIAGLADRDTPPWLVDTSSVRIDSGYLDLPELVRAASDARVRAVLFANRRLASVSGFHSWVARHYHLVRAYGAGVELWIR